MKHFIAKAFFLTFALIFSLLFCVFNPSSFGVDDMDADALLEEGWRFFHGDGVVQDIPKGVSLIVDAANKGSIQAMLEVGYFYNLGLGSLISEDYVDGTGSDLALSWFEKVAEAGDPDTAGMTIASAGFDYFLGSDDGLIKEDDTVALKYFQKAAEYGNPSAINMLATFYTYGFGVDQSPSKALELYCRLADDGNEEALFSIEELAYDYYAGIKDGLDINFGTSFAYYLKLTEYNNERAMYNVGLLYEYGLGVAADHEKAVEWLTEASDLGFEPAKAVLTQMNNA